jgi:hypothetical protein
VRTHFARSDLPHRTLPTQLRRYYSVVPSSVKVRDSGDVLEVYWDYRGKKSGLFWLGESSLPGSFPLKMVSETMKRALRWWCCNVCGNVSNGTGGDGPSRGRPVWDHERRKGCHYGMRRGDLVWSDRRDVLYCGSVGWVDCGLRCENLRLTSC